MATLTAPAAARAAAKDHGLALPAKPETLVPTEPKGSEKQIRIAQRREQERTPATAPSCRFETEFGNNPTSVSAAKHKNGLEQKIVI